MRVQIALDRETTHFSLFPAVTLYGSEILVTLNCESNEKNNIICIINNIRMVDLYDDTFNFLLIIIDHCYIFTIENENDRANKTTRLSHMIILKKKFVTPFMINLYHKYM